MKYLNFHLSNVAISIADFLLQPHFIGVFFMFVQSSALNYIFPGWSTIEITKSGRF